MARRDKVFLSILTLALLGSIALSLMLGWYLWRESVVTEEHRLEALSQTLGQQVEHTIIDARDLLTQLNNTVVDPCSSQHLKNMQEQAVARPYIRAIGYWRAADRLCGAGFIQGVSFTPPHASRIYESGVIAWWPSEETQVGGVELFLMRYGEHDLVIDPRLILSTEQLENQMAGLWVEGLPMVTVPSEAELPPLDSLPLGLTVDRDNQRLISRFSLGTIFPIDIVALQPMSQFWQRYLPTLVTAGLLGLLLIPLWIYIVLRYSRQHLSLAAELRDAIANHQIQIHYQAIMDMTNGRCTGAESLARWTREDGETVSPDVFIPIAEEAGMTTDLAISMLQGILRELGPHLKTCPDLSINLNLSAQDLETDRLLERLDKELHAAQLPATAIKLELTERALIDNNDARKRISALRRKGHHIAIDDFGTGYSSLSYLESFELDTLKIDKVFVDAIETPAVTSGVINHVIEMAKSLNLDIVAEGIESRHQVEWLLDHGVTLGQGYVFSKPVPARQFIHFYQRHKGTGPSP